MNSLAALFDVTEEMLELAGCSVEGLDAASVVERLLVATSSASEAEAGASDELAADSRVGPDVVQLNRGRASEQLSVDGLLLESRGNFCSCSANVSVSSGLWCYEVVLGTAGIQQLGWATGGEEHWTSEEGESSP